MQRNVFSFIISCFPESYLLIYLNSYYEIPICVSSMFFDLYWTTGVELEDTEHSFTSTRIHLCFDFKIFYIQNFRLCFPQFNIRILFFSTGWSHYFFTFRSRLNKVAVKYWGRFDRISLLLNLLVLWLYQRSLF